MKKNLLVLGALTVTLALGDCMDGKKQGEVSSKDLENASSVETYYNNTLVLLQRMVEEKDVNAVLKYMDMGQNAPAIPDFTPLVISQRDSAEAVSPGDYFNKESRENLSQNFRSLFSARRLFYDNFNNYMDLMRMNNAVEAKKYIDANYKLSI